MDNAIAVLEQSDRVRLIYLRDVSSSHLEKLSAATREPFPELTYLELSSCGEVVLPDSFLGGYAPRLQSFELNGIPFPGLPKLLLSAPHIVELYLHNIPHSGYISPKEMVTALSTLTNLGSLILEFQSPRSRPDRPTRHLPPPRRSVLSVLKCFDFKGDSGYLDDLVAHIDAPRLYILHITFFNQIIFDAPQLIQFICRTPRLKALETADVNFEGGAAAVSLLSLTSGYGELSVNILCRKLDWQVSSLEQVCNLSLPLFFMLKDLYIHESPYSPPHWQDNIENALWLELLHPFIAAKNLYLSEEFTARIVPALQELVGSTATEVLPALQNIFLERPSGHVREGIRQFVATRQVTTGSRPISVSHWIRDRTMFQ
jgi:hypothetical protein